ncbi:hypothetical protein GCM10017556_30130 [Micromonospora sagamiensis]|nr:hypothetical protein GCM10017556_30130 [Micromonospora sagamiensis]
MTAAMTTYDTLAPVRESLPPSAAKIPDICVLLYRTLASAGGTYRPDAWMRTRKRSRPTTDTRTAKITYSRW